MLRSLAIVFLVALGALRPVTAGSAFHTGSDQTCQPTGSIMRLAGLPEASGLVASRTTPGRLWAHNDSGKPEIFALDLKGKVEGRVTLSGAGVQDWEAMTSGPCGTGTCLFIADIGDNGAKRASITVYRVPEPTKAAGAAKVDAVFRASYPDGAHDAEAIMAAADGGLYIVTKGDTGHIALYRFPRELKSGATMRLERIGAPIAMAGAAEHTRITDGTISPDGQWAVLRSRAALTFYRAEEFLKGNFREVRRVDLRGLGEPQGEGVAFGAKDTIYVAGEGGGKSAPGTLAALSCAG